ncbi:MAG: histidine kinase, partial [Novibacillus thermophilus]
MRNSRKIDIALLDKVIKNTVEAVERSKSQIFEIAEMARKEEEALYQKLQQVEAEVRHVIREVDRLEVQY